MIFPYSNLILLGIIIYINPEVNLSMEVSTG